MEIDFGLLVGMIGPQGSFKNILPINCFQVPIGPGEEIASSKILRKGSLDTLIVSWGEIESVEGALEELLISGEQLLVVAQSWKAVKKIFVSVE